MFFFQKYFKSIISHNVARNSLALIALQFVSIVAPLIVFPYLSRVLGLDGFGLVMLALSACAIGLIITDFGFNLSGTYKVSLKRKDIDYVSELIGAIFIIKLILGLSFFTCIVIYNYFIGFGLESNNLIFYIGFNVLVQVFLPTWFFQGIERMKNVTFYMVIAKLIFVILVFSFINKKTDAELVILFYSISNLFAVVIAIRSIYLSGYFVGIPVNIRLVDVFKDSSQFFLSRAAVSIYTAASTFLVGAFAGLQQAAVYGANEKLYQASQSITGPIAQALFPHMANKKDSRLLMKILIFVGTPLAFGCMMVGLWAGDILALIFGEEFRESGHILQLFLVVTVVNFVAVNFGYPAFASISKVYLANYTVMLGALVQIFCLMTLYITDSFSSTHVVISVLTTEIVVMSSRVFLYKYHKTSSK
jgi:O-antigen/teichoic acid export membrane protein